MRAKPTEINDLNKLTRGKTIGEVVCICEIRSWREETYSITHPHLLVAQSYTYTTSQQPPMLKERDAFDYETRNTDFPQMFLLCQFSSLTLTSAETRVSPAMVAMKTRPAILHISNSVPCIKFQLVSVENEPELAQMMVKCLGSNYIYDACVSVWIVCFLLAFVPVYKLIHYFPYLGVNGLSSLFHIKTFH